MRRGVLDCQPRLVGELAEIDLVRVPRASQRADIRAGAEYVLLAGADHDGAHLRMLEAQPANRVGQFDIDPEIIGIELQLGAGEQPGGRIDVERQCRDRPPDFEPPMAIASRGRGEVYLHWSEAGLHPVAVHECPIGFETEARSVADMQKSVAQLGMGLE